VSRKLGALAGRVMIDIINHNTAYIV